MTRTRIVSRSRRGLAALALGLLGGVAIGSALAEEPIRDLSAHARARLEEWKAAAEADPDDMVALARYGWGLVQAGRVDEGMEILERARLRAPDEPGVLVRVARALWRAEKTDEAIAAARRVAGSPLATDAQKADALALIGIDAWKRRDLGLAERALREAVAYEPNDVHSRINLAMVLIDRGRLPEALAELELASRRAGDDAGAYKRIGDLMFVHGQRERGLRAYEDVVRVRPKHVATRSMLAKLYMEDGAWADAERHLAALAEIEPDAGEVRLAWAQCLLELGRLDEAERQAREASRRGQNAASLLEKIEQARAR